jgi:uncharacterized membrane protein
MLDILIRKPKQNTSTECNLKVSDRADKPLKSILKSVSWRIVGTLDTILISFIITGKVTVALSIGTVEVITKTVLYYFHERLWARIHSIRIKGWSRINLKRYEFGRIKQSS